MQDLVFVTLIRSKILAHKFVYSTDAELELDFPASVPSWKCRDESRFRLSESLFWREMLKCSLKAQAKGGC